MFQPELWNLLAKLLNMCLKESCFPYFWKVSFVVAAFKNVGERTTAKNYSPVSLLFVVSKLFEKLINNRIFDHLEKCGLFYDFQYGFRSSRSTAGPLTVVSDRIVRVFNRPRATRALALDISKAVCLFLVIDSFMLFWMGSLHKNIQLMLQFLRAPFLVQHFPALH